MTGTLTYSGKIGPGLTLTTQIFNDVTDLDYQFDRGVLKVTYGIPSKIAYLDLTASTVMSNVVVAGVSVAATVS